MGAAVEDLVREGMDRLAAVAEVPPGLAGRAYPAAPRRAVGGPALDTWLAVPPAVTLAVGLWGVTARPYWGDEVDTLAAVSRSLPQLARLLGHVDAVHGLYYLVLWPVVRVAGTGELATRLPSVVAMAGAALGVSVLGRRLKSPRAGLCAGLVFAALPILTQQAHDARPYAMVTGAAVLASYLLVRAADDPRPARWVAYGLALVLVGYLQLFALLLLPAHALTMAAQRRQPGEAPARVARPWLVTAAAAAAGVAPVAVWGWRQRGRIGWIGQPGWPDVTYLACWLAAGSAASAALIAALAILGARHADPPVPAHPPRRVRPRRPGDWPGMTIRPPHSSQRLTWLALPWLALPPGTLLAASQIQPVYSFRYVIFCLPAVALLAGAGLAALGQVLRAAALALLIALAAPAQLALRVPGSGAGGGLQAAAQVLATHERPGDAVIYPGPTIPPWYLAYPRAFRPLRNIGLSHPGATIGHLYASSVLAPVLIRRERGVSRLWVIETGPPWPDPCPDLAPGFRLTEAWQPHHDQVRLALYRRSQQPTSEPSPQCR